MYATQYMTALLSVVSVCASLYECCVLAAVSYQSVPNGMMFTREFTLISLPNETTGDAKEMAFGLQAKRDDGRHETDKEYVYIDIKRREPLKLNGNESEEDQF